MKTPKEVTAAIKKLDPSDQVIVQTFIAKLRAQVVATEAELKPDDGHAHYHGHDKCTADHGHDGDQHAPEEKESHAHGHGHEKCTSDHGHDHDQHAPEEKESHAHGHDDHKCTEDHSHGHDHHKPVEDHHSHGHDHHKCTADHSDDTPAWKKKAMAGDSSAAPFGGSWAAESSLDATASTTPLPPLYSPPNEDFDTAMALKQEAADLKSSKSFDAALEKYNEAILAAPPSALLYANRADVLFKLDEPSHSVRDCNEALKLNPDSAKALRIRGRARKVLGEYPLALKDLSNSQMIDFDEGVVDDLKFVQEKIKGVESVKTKKRVEEEDKLRKRSGEIRKAREQEKNDREEKEKKEKAAAQAAAAAAPTVPPAGMPGGMPGGMPDMPGMPAGLGGIMSLLASDPELREGMQNPKIMAAFSELMKSPGGAMGLMSNPAKFQELMGDPEVGPFLKKLMAKIGPMMMGGGMPGGMPNMDGMPNMPGAGGDIPDMSDDDVPNLS